MTIPWDDDSDRPAWLPYPGEASDAETAALIAARYLDRVRAMLAEIDATIAAHYVTQQRWMTIWTAEMILKHWGPELDYVLLGFVTVDERQRGASFHTVSVSVDKESGQLVTRDPHGLLRG